jgi:Glycosyl hydrolase family 76
LWVDKAAILAMLDTPGLVLKRLMRARTSGAGSPALTTAEPAVGQGQPDASPEHLGGALVAPATGDGEPAAVPAATAVVDGEPATVSAATVVPATEAHAEATEAHADDGEPPTEDGEPAPAPAEATESPTEDGEPPPPAGEATEPPTEDGEPPPPAGEATETPTEDGEPAPPGDESATVQPSRLRRRLTLLVLSLMVCSPASLAFAEPVGPMYAYVPPPPAVPNCHARRVRCGTVERLAASNRAAVRAKLRPGAILGAATQGMRELLGFGDPHNPLRFDPNSGLWGGYTSYHTSDANPDWWQSALATWTLVRYLEATGSADPAYQDVLDRIFELNVSRPRGPRAPGKFANEYMDDTGWWALAWTEAARYELNVRGDSALAARYLHIAEWDENYIARAPRSCGGIVWQLSYPADTISTAEFAALSAELYAIRRARGPFHDTAKAARWLHLARWALVYMRSRNLVSLRTGTVRDGLTRGCRPVSGALTYTEGEVADAYIQMGAALHDKAYFADARRFLEYTMWAGSGMSRDHVLQEYCESRRQMCHGLRQFDVSSFKGIFVQAVADYDLATRTHLYRAWLQVQAAAILSRAVSNGTRRTSCATPHLCQFGLYWSRDVAPASARVGVSLASQTSALQALTAALDG